MTIDEVIQKLEDIKQAHGGDVPVFVVDDEFLVYDHVEQIDVRRRVQVYHSFAKKNEKYSKFVIITHADPWKS